MPATKRLDAGRRGAADLTSPGDLALLRERRRRLAALPRYDRYIAEAAGNLTLQAFWRNLRRQDLEDAQRLGAWLGCEAVPPAGAGGETMTAPREAVAGEVRHGGSL